MHTPNKETFIDKKRGFLNSVGSAITAIRRFVRQLQREGRGHMEVVAFHSDRIVITLKADGHRHKIFQILFRKDGSLFVNFPYFSKTQGVLAEVTVNGAPGSSCEVNLADTGRVASHLVKYSHHPDGRAHFSQDGKIKTEIKRQSVPLRDQQGHIFTLLFQGLRAFTSVNATYENSDDGFGWKTYKSNLYAQQRSAP